MQQYQPIAINRKTGEQREIDIRVTLSEREAIQIQIDMSTAERVIMMKPVYKDGKSCK